MTAAPANGIHSLIQAMIVTCPSCGTRYKVEEAFPAAGRIVRCAKCRATWLQAGGAALPQPPVAETVAPTVSPPAPSLSLRAALAHASDAASHSSVTQDAAPDETRTRWRLTVLMAAVALLLLAGGAAIHYRSAVTAFWPQAARAYSAVGLPHRP